MYALVELHNDKYQPLADLTWNQNKLEYAKLHGYQTFCKTDNFVEGSGIGYQKIHYIKSLMIENPNIEWFWWTGTDTLVTNFGTRIEDRIDSQYHFIVSVDVNGINADSFLIRNTPEGLAYIQELLDLENECSKHWDAEQRAMDVSLGFPPTSDQWWRQNIGKISVCEKYKNVVKLMPQRYMNSFNYQLYHYTDHRDVLGWDGNWQLGDWLIHWPATSLEYRIQLVNFYKGHVIT